MKQTKSKSRVRDFGEVFTAEREVRAMCDLIPQEVWENIERTFLEPACGNGNFLVEILARKLRSCATEEDGLKALASIFGIDIQADNCAESRHRLKDMFFAKFPTANVAQVETILQKNIVCGDSLAIMQEWENDGNGI